MESEQNMERTGAHTWSISKPDSSDKAGMIPVIHISNFDTSESLWVYMDIDDALLGKLIKHSLMTEVPIEYPLKEYLQKADCMKCYPSHIDIGGS
jgi:hypothetical protein